MRNLILKAAFNQTTGYFTLVKNTICILDKYYNLQLENIHDGPVNPRFGNNIINRINVTKLSRINRPLELLITPLKINAISYDELPYPYYDNRIILTMWETTKISNFLRQILNSYRATIVPSTWNYKNFLDCGINNLEILPLFSEDIYQPTPQNLNRLTFGAICGGEFHSQRKNLRTIPYLFTKAFPTQKDVFLKIKCLDNRFYKYTDNRITINNKYFDILKLKNWYDSINVLINLSNAEGWGFIQNEAMACGRPLLGPIYGGVADFTNENNSFLVKYNEVPAKDYFSFTQGLWCEYDSDDLIQKMQYIYNNKQEIITKSQLASNVTQVFNSQNFEKNLFSIINKYIN